MTKRVKLEVRTFFFGFSIGVLFLYVFLGLFSSQETTPPCSCSKSLIVHRKVPDDPSSTPSPRSSPSPYLFMKKDQGKIISQALKNGEDLRMRGKLFKLYRPIFTCPYKVVRWGSVPKNGAKWVCGGKELYSGGTNRTCVVYSFGVDGDSSFEADVLKYTNCEIYAYDHTVNSISKPLHSDNPRVNFRKFGLADFSNLGDKGNGTFKTVKQVMSINGHKWIDILKLDVEGAEFDGMTMLMDDFDQLPIGQLQVEYHLWHDNSQIYSKIIPWLNRLEEKGLRTFWATPNARDPAKFNIDCRNSSHMLRTYEYSFININSDAFRNSTFTFEKLLMGAAINTDLHYPVN